MNTDSIIITIRKDNRKKEKERPSDENDENEREKPDKGIPVVGTNHIQVP